MKVNEVQVNESLDKIDSTVLWPIHIEHLLAEGFKPKHILEWYQAGLRSLTEEKATALGFKVWVSGEWRSGSGIYFPFTPTFGQVRLDSPLVREKGKPAKYLTPHKKRSQAYIPERCGVVTEGIKDAFAGTIIGEIPTGAIAGVSHYRKTLPQGAGYTTIFDSDGWYNPQVFRNLINMGIWLIGKVQLLPEIPGQPKGGLCEYFKAGYTAEDYKNLIATAYTPKELIMEWAKHWEKMPDLWMSLAIRTLIDLAVQHLDPLEVEAVLRRIKKATGTSVMRLRTLQLKAIEKHGLDNDVGIAKKLDCKQLYDFVEKEYGNRLRLNELGQTIELDGEEFDVDKAYIKLLKYYNLNVSKYFTADVFCEIAESNSYNPVTEYLEKVGTTVKPLEINNLSSRYFHTTDPIYDIFLKKTLISAVARALNPGCKVDTALVLQGDQGVGKSTFYKILGGDWFDDSMGDGRDKDDLLKLHKCWIQEWSEIERIFGKRQAGEIKAFLSKRTDLYRVPYGRITKEYPRGSIIVASVNNAQFLVDSTGNRRYWIIPVKVSAIDLEMLRKERDAIWSAAVAAYKAGESWWLTREEQELSETNNEQFQIVDEWATEIASYVDGLKRVSVTEILERCFDYEIGKIERGSQMRVATILSSLGWQKIGMREHLGKRQQCWSLPQPQEYPPQKPPSTEERDHTSVKEKMATAPIENREVNSSVVAVLERPPVDIKPTPVSTPVETTNFSCPIASAVEKPQLKNQTIERENPRATALENSQLKTVSSLSENSIAKLYETDEQILQLAEWLESLDSPEGLAELKKCDFYSRELFNKAASLLSSQTRARLNQYALAINNASTSNGSTLNNDGNASDNEKTELSKSQNKSEPNDDYSSYPHPTSKNPAACRNRASKCKEIMLGSSDSNQLEDGLSINGFSEHEIKWVYTSLLNPREQKKFDEVRRTSQLDVFNQ